MGSPSAKTREPAGPVLAEVGRIAGSIAGELGDLLTAINGHADIALEAIGEGNPVARASITTIRDAGDRAAQLAAELLALSDPPGPRSDSREPIEASGSSQNGSVGIETVCVLLVEDNDVVRGLVQEMLVGEGCQVLAAASPREALELSNGFHGVIDLLVTDMVMPQMNGRELAARLLHRRPELNVVYTSRYANDAFIDGGVIAPGTSFLQKPFTTSELAAVVHEIAGRPAA